MPKVNPGKEGIHVKDLDRINRDLRKVQLAIEENYISYEDQKLWKLLTYFVSQTIIIDWNDKAVEDHRMNAIVLPKWKGNDDDRTLFDLVALLKSKFFEVLHTFRILCTYWRI